MRLTKKIGNYAVLKESGELFNDEPLTDEQMDELDIAINRLADYEEYVGYDYLDQKIKRKEKKK